MQEKKATTTKTTTKPKAGHSPTRRPEVPPTSKKKPSTKKKLVSDKTAKKTGQATASVAKKVEEGAPKFWERTFNGMNTLNTHFTEILDNAVEKVKDYRSDD